MEVKQTTFLEAKKGATMESKLEENQNQSWKQHRKKN